MARTDTDDQDAEMAAGEEGRFFAELHKVVPPSKNIPRIDFRFGEDSDGEPAVWITIYTDADIHPSEDKLAEINRASEQLRSAIFRSKYARWPYVQVKAE